VDQDAPLRLFRMPWSSSDNAMSWLEPTRRCNIACDACFATNDPASEKPLERIEAELEAILKLRRSDGIFIAGGEPLTHPRIVDVVRMVAARRLKPVLVTNAVGLTPALLKDLKRAGLFGFTFHVDSHQSRPGWKGKTEAELNALRQRLADMVHDEGGLICGFNVTVFPDTLADVPDIVAWGLANVDKVQSYTLTMLRLVEADAGFAYYAGDRRIDVRETVYFSPTPYRRLTSADVRAEVRKVIPDFRLCAFLGGTARSDALKLGLGCVIATPGRTFGHLGPRTMELLQNGHHWLTGRYFAFGRPGLNRRGRLLFLLGFVDREVRRSFGRYLRAALRDPLLLFQRVHVQTINVEQPFDILPDGEQDHCDGCPNKTLWRDRLVPACLLEEYMRYGTSVVAVPTGTAGG
jgi:Radical SAM superfamily